jgi:FkbM family methyltransferase
MSAPAPRLIEHDYVAVRQCRHGLFAYNLNDTYVGRSLDAYGEWSEAELSVLFQVLKPGDLVVDVGANVGTHTVACAKRVTASGAVYALEPQRVTFQFLCANVALNALINVKCINAAAGDVRGEVRIPALDPTVANNFGAMKSEGHANGELVDTIRIDDLSLARCNLIKIDVEGMEARVLAGARKTIAAHRPVLFVENNFEDGSRGLLQALSNLGYTSWWHIAEAYNPQNFFGNDLQLFGGYREANLLCFPKEAQVNAVGLTPVEGLDDTHLRAMRRRL